MPKNTNKIKTVTNFDLKTDSSIGKNDAILVKFEIPISQNIAKILLKQ